ncbi:MAG TPA: hypothetical protein VN829_04795, partial [Dongiaceae bacterium]|nr:hypothetical protein [Dongiaceae bacterium]
GENFKTALSLKSMLDDLILHRVERIIDSFKGDLTPFQNIGNYKDYDVYFMNPSGKGAHFGLDIWVEPESYSFEFWDRKDPEAAKGQAEAMLKRIGCLEQYTPKGRGFHKDFAFPSQEGDLIKHISTFKRKLDKAIKSASHSP